MKTLPAPKSILWSVLLVLSGLAYTYLASDPAAAAVEAQEVTTESTTEVSNHVLGDVLLLKELVERAGTLVPR